MIYTFRDQQVMMDYELAKLYGITTSALNRAVKRNIERFPNDFMFQINEKEYLRCQNGIAKSKRRYLPYAFTENGVAILSCVIRSSVAHI